MERPRNPSCVWSLFIAATLAMSSDTHAQSLASNLGMQESNSVPGRVASPTAAAPGIAKSSQRSMAGGLISIELAPAATLAPQALRELPNPNFQAVAPPTRPEATPSLIDAHSVACQAALQWLPAKQLRQQAQAVQELYCESETCARQAANAIAKFLCMQANHQQDLAAANALRAYYGHSAITEQFDLLQQSLAELQRQRELQAGLQGKGLAAAVDLTSLDRESIALASKRIQLEQRDRQLQRSLNDATCMQHDWLTSAVESLEIREQTVDAAYLERFALTHRHDLLALQYLSAQIHGGTAPLLASTVHSAAGMASLPLPKRCLVDRLLGREDNSLLMKNLRESIALACEAQTRTIRREVSETASALELSYQQTALAEETSASWNKRIEQLQRLTELGDNRPLELALASSSLLTAHADEIERRLESKLAEIALAEACGGLSHRCCHGLAWLTTGPTP